MAHALIRDNGYTTAISALITQPLPEIHIPDMPMLEAAGWGIAMENAEEAVKDKADKVTLSNNEDGIAYAIKKWLLD